MRVGSRFAGYLAAAVLAGFAALVLTGCTEEDLLPQPLVQISAESGTPFDLIPSNWDEPCFQQETTLYVHATMSFAAVGGIRTEYRFTDPSCTTPDATPSVTLTNLVVTATGSQAGVTWIPSPAPGASPTVTATKAIISGTDPSTGPFSFKSILFAVDTVSPVTLQFGDDSGTAVLDIDGYPTQLTPDGATQVP